MSDGKCSTCEYSRQEYNGNGTYSLFCNFVMPLNIAVALGMTDNYELSKTEVINDFGCSLHKPERKE